MVFVLFLILKVNKILNIFENITSNNLKHIGKLSAFLNTTNMLSLEHFFSLSNVIIFYINCFCFY